MVEKILEGDEPLPADWPCAGTTGYDALLRIGGVLVDPAGAAPLTELYTQLTGEPADFAAVVDEAKRFVVEHGLHAEVARLVEVAAAICHDHLELRDHTRRGIRESLVELLVAMPVYRAYVVPGEPAPDEARADPRRRRRGRRRSPRRGPARHAGPRRAARARAASAAARTGTSSSCASSRPADR